MREPGGADWAFASGQLFTRTYDQATRTFGPETPLVTDAGNNFYPSWSPDGQWVMFNRDASNGDAYDNANGSLFVINGATNINDFAQVVITDQAVTTASLVAAVLFRPDPGGDGAESFDTQSGHVIPANMQLCASHNVAADVFGGLVRGYLTKAR